MTSSSNPSKVTTISLVLLGSVGGKRWLRTESEKKWGKPDGYVVVQEIGAGELTVLFVDGYHLLWEDLTGYVWDKTD